MDKKFRVWDNENKRMSEPFHIWDIMSDCAYDCPAPALIWAKKFDIEVRELEDKEKYETLQYIGLNDKKGKEIYEGYIVSQGTIGEIIWEGDGKIIRPPYGEVYYNENGAYFDIKTLQLGIYEVDGEQIENLHMNHYDGVFQWIERKRQEDLEIIGNKFENLELIKKEV